MLGDLSDRRLVEKVYEGKYAIVNWREQDDPAEHALRWWEIRVDLLIADDSSQFNLNKKATPRERRPA